MASLRSHDLLYRADWEPAAASRRRTSGVLGVPSDLVGTIYTQFNSGFRENSDFEKINRFFLCACGYMVDWPHVAQVRFWRPKGPHSEKKTCRLAILRIMGQKIADFSKKEVSIFLPLWVKRGCFGSRNGVLGCFGPNVREQA